MADVEMTDAGAASKPVKSTKAGASGEVDSKKPKFEVKKVCTLTVRLAYLTAY